VGVHDFEAILGAAREGSEWAWKLIYADLAPRLLGYLRVRGARDAENLVGEVFVQLARNLAGFRGDESGFQSWVFIIAHHRLLNERRKVNRRPEVLVAPADTPEPVASPSAEDIALENIAGERALAMLERLTPEQRSVLGLRLVGGFTVEDTARVLERTPGAVKQLQRRALAALRRQIEQGAVTL